MKNVVQSRLGFTLIELLVVVLIIGILAAVALPQYQQAVEKSRTAEAFSNISSFAKAVEVWKLANPDIERRCFTGSCYGVGQLDIDIPSDWVQGTDTMMNPLFSSALKSCSKNFCYAVDTDSVRAYRANSSTYKYGIEYYLYDHHYECEAKTEADLKFCNLLSNMDSVDSEI